MSQASGMSMEEMLNTFAADPTEGRAWMKFPVAHNADGDAYCDDGGGDVLLTRVESDAAHAKVEQINNLSEANDGDNACSLRARYKDSHGRVRYRLVDELTGSTIEFVFENQLPAICELMQKGCPLYAAAGHSA